MKPSDPTTQTDGICLDGAKLFEEPPGSGIYVPEKQDFSQTTHDVSGEFVVLTKAGETRIYGRDPVDRVNASNGETAVWALDRVIDVWGNYFDIHYNKDQGTTDTQQSFSASGIWVSEIDYTGFLNDINPVASGQPFNAITFQYESRPDVRWTRYASLKIPQNQRLTSITTPQGTYSLSYVDESAPSAP
ncbi:MAG TPA: hypothetical protein VK781_09795, partial [Solirubrobacteraceae bacterium]|nr:hypothetical protein [Solirubrobacteraceae bacterium]